MAGTTQRITLESSEYPASAWTGHLGIVGQGIDRRASWSASGDDHAFVFTHGDTASWPPGEYRWQFIAEEQASNERINVRGGTFLVSRDMLAKVPYQSHNERMLAALKDYQAGRMEQDAAESFSIDGQSFTHTPAREITRQIAIYEIRVNLERARERRAIGLPNRKVRNTFI